MDVLLLVDLSLHTMMLLRLSYKYIIYCNVFIFIKSICFCVVCVLCVVCCVCVVCVLCVVCCVLG